MPDVCQVALLSTSRPLDGIARTMISRLDTTNGRFDLEIGRYEKLLARW
jgi:hypothetical protein